jgi:hypothetical protein
MPSPISRSAFVLVFATEPYEKKAGVAVPNYEPTGDFVCSLLGLLYGKRFDAHGSLEMSGMFGLPDLTEFSEFCDPVLPFNSHKPRADIGIPLSLMEVRRIAPLLEGTPHDEARAAVLFGARRFYLRALQAAEIDPEVAYLHLITAGEILSNAHEVRQIDLIDDEARLVLDRIQNELQGGARVANFVRGRLRQIKRRFLRGICTFIDPGFFQRREAEHPFEALREDQFEACIAAAYDLRSRYVHTGVSFGGWIQPRFGNAERQSGKPVVKDAEMAGILERAPTFLGLERIMRYALLKFAETLGANISLESQEPLAEASLPR